MFFLSNALGFHGSPALAPVRPLPVAPTPSPYEFVAPMGQVSSSYRYPPSPIVRAAWAKVWQVDYSLASGSNSLSGTIMLGPVGETPFRRTLERESDQDGPLALSVTSFGSVALYDQESQSWRPPLLVLATALGSQAVFGGSTLSTEGYSLYPGIALKIAGRSYHMVSASGAGTVTGSIDISIAEYWEL